MEYKNRETGVIIDVDSEINGGNWVKIEVESKKPESDKKAEKKDG